MKAKVYNQIGEELEDLELNPKIFGLKPKPELIQQAVVALQANSRQVLAHTKDRGDVAGGGRKPWRQKGTGRARHGSIRSPLWRGGGITFGPTKERNFTLKMNKKAKRLALLMSLSDKAANQKIIFVDQLELGEAKTKNFFAILKNLNLRDKKEKKSKTAVKPAVKSVGRVKKPALKKVLVVLPRKDEKIKRAAKNIPALLSLNAGSLNVLTVLSHQYLLMPLAAIKEIEKTFIK